MIEIKLVVGKAARDLRKRTERTGTDRPDRAPPWPQKREAREPTRQVHSTLILLPSDSHVGT
jgi:hypothetical protein